MTVPGLAEALGAPERQVRSRINELREDGRVTNVGDGRWELRVTPTAEDDPDEIPM
jgi:DNA-directed RNA polymerase delta subunit